MDTSFASIKLIDTRLTGSKLNLGYIATDTKDNRFLITITDIDLESIELEVVSSEYIRSMIKSTISDTKATFNVSNNFIITKLY